VYFVSSRFVTESNGVKNQLVAGDTDNSYKYEIDKTRLIPTGEYLPYVMVGMLRAIRADDVINHFRRTREIVTDGPSREMLLKLGGYNVGAGICSSIIAPDDYRKMARKGADIFTNSAYLGVFNNSKLYNWKHYSMAKSIAIANARTIVQAANNGPSFVIDGNGRSLFITTETAATEIEVMRNNRRTPYTVFGEYVGFSGLILILIHFVKSRVRR
jgi:apolipoprotein N-acyltransferase